MKTLHRYFLKEVLASVLMTVAVFTFVMLLGNVLKEILGMLINRQATLTMVGIAIGLLIPFVLVFALPAGLLTATLLVFGRASADHELTAARANGISLLSLISPILILSVVLSIVSGLITMELGPRSRVAYKKIIRQAGISQAAVFIPEKVFIKEIPNLIFYAEEVKKEQMKGVLIYVTDSAGNLQNYVRAEEGQLMLNPTNNMITVRLKDVWRVDISNTNRPDMVFMPAAEFDYTNLLAKAEEKVKVSDMTLLQLWRELHDLRARLGEGQGKLEGVPAGVDPTLPVKMHIHRQVSFSFACIAFTLVGIPLGIRAHRRETTFGIAGAIILVVVYYSFYVLGNSLGNHPELKPYLILWVPNFIFQAVGMFLLWRGNRGYW